VYNYTVVWLMSILNAVVNLGVVKIHQSDYCIAMETNYIIALVYQLRVHVCLAAYSV